MQTAAKPAFGWSIGPLGVKETVGVDCGYLAMQSRLRVQTSGTSTTDRNVHPTSVREINGWLFPRTTWVENQDRVWL